MQPMLAHGADYAGSVNDLFAVYAPPVAGGGHDPDETTWAFSVGVAKLPLNLRQHPEWSMNRGGSQSEHCAPHIEPFMGMAGRDIPDDDRTPRVRLLMLYDIGAPMMPPHLPGARPPLALSEIELMGAPDSRHIWRYAWDPSLGSPDRPDNPLNDYRRLPTEDPVDNVDASAWVRAQNGSVANSTVGRWMAANDPAFFAIRDPVEAQDAVILWVDLLGPGSRGSGWGPDWALYNPDPVTEQRRVAEYMRKRATQGGKKEMDGGDD